MLKISFANFFIFGICFFFAWVWLVLGTNLFKKADEISGTKKGKADLLVRNEGGIGEEEQKLINEKLDLIKNPNVVPAPDSRMKSTFLPEKSDTQTTTFQRDKPSNEIPDILKTESNNSGTATANQDETEPEDTPPNASDFFNDFDDNIIEGENYNKEEIEGTKPIFIESGLKPQLFARAEWMEELEQFIAEFELLSEDEKNSIKQQGEEVYQKILVIQKQQMEVYKLDKNSMVYRTATSFEEIASDENFISKHDLFLLNTKPLTNIELQYSSKKNLIVKEQYSMSA
ncbi:hypothetical protein LV89_04758 [Arcicella aurantiaca]|uniref:Uncharacterized protein n=2 Tax=Arcicella aurantiaca TaxID=591202 RepID=A0A316E1U1_9BACT|nr:hypothetical protein LV89_04758 [Arcicella aurantiaca]